MNAQWNSPATVVRRLAPMTNAHLDTVMAIERAAYAVPWTRGNFIDSLASAYLAQCLLDEQGAMLGYFVAMQGAGEMHLLNLTVVPAVQRRGHARHMLEAIVATCRSDGVAQLWLEVRTGNVPARSLYRRFGLVEVGVRRDYYPAAGHNPSGGREDAVVMSLMLGGVA